MASEKIRNIIKSKVNSAISLARKQVEQYGRGKLNEINKQLEDPKTLVDVLLVNVDNNTCSDNGAVNAAIASPPVGAIPSV